MLIVEPGNPLDDQPRALLEQSHTLLTTSFAPEDNYFLDFDALCQPGVHFLIAREGPKVLGVAALVEKDGYAEVKSMFTDPAARGNGVGAALMRGLEDHARALKLTKLKLETAGALGAAVRLYERHGFTPCGLFGDYTPNKVSLFMEKAL